MNVYRVYGVSLSSEIPLPELKSADMGDPEYVFHIAAARTQRREPDHWLYRWRHPDGRAFLSCARLGRDYLLRFPGRADFVLRRELRDIECLPAPSGSDDLVRQLFLDHVLPRVLAARGKLVVHASAVTLAGEAVMFLGPSGSGKSTLAASFCYADRSSLVTDDCLLIDIQNGSAHAFPSYAHLRLWPEAREAVCGRAVVSGGSEDRLCKERLEGDIPVPFQHQPVSLRRAYVLGSPQTSERSGIGVETLSVQQAVVELLRHTFRLDITNRTRLRDEFSEVGRLARSIEIRRVHFTRDFAALPQLRQAILADLGAS